MPGKAAWQRLSAAFAEHGSFLLENPAQRGPVGIVATSESSWLFSIDPIHESNRYVKRLQEDYQLPLTRRHYPRDLLHEEADFSAYRVLLLPHLPILQPETRRRLVEWVRAGGQLMLGPMTGTRSEEMTTWTDREYGGLEELMGARQAMRFSPHWVEDTIEVVFEDGGRCHPRIWCDAFAPDADTRVLARYSGGYGDGLPAVVEQDFGKGRVITLGCPLDEAAFLGVFGRLAQAAGVEPLAAGGESVLSCPRVDADGRLSALGFINTTKEEESLTLAEGLSGTDLLSGETCSGTVSFAPLQVRLVRLHGRD
jgi:beta-galactosidase